jgi:hypothetical protein
MAVVMHALSLLIRHRMSHKAMQWRDLALA